MKFPHQRELARYYSMPKDFVGPSEADDLIFMHEAMIDAKRSWSYQFVAGSAAAESGLMATHLPASERHARLNAADEAWRRAQDGFIMNHVSDDWEDERLYTIPDRVQMHRMYIELYRDMVDGEVRDETIVETHRRLVGLAVSNLEQHDRAEEKNDFAAMMYRRGLGYELGTILTATRLRCPSIFAIPSPVRADNGEYFPEKTHDVRLVQQSWGEINWWTPYEVKPVTSERTRYYESPIVRGRVELQMPSAKTPLELARFMQEEVDGTISPQHLAELDEITSRVFRLAQEYKRKQGLAAVALSA